MFAVSYALALVGDDATRADGVTLLPLGKKWTALALECVGVSSMGLRLSQEEEPSNEEVSSPSTYYLSLSLSLCLPSSKPIASPRLSLFVCLTRVRTTRCAPHNRQLAQVALISRQLKNSSRERDGAAADIWRIADSLFQPWLEQSDPTSNLDTSIHSATHSSSASRMLSVNPNADSDTDKDTDYAADESSPLGLDGKGEEETPLGIVLSAANWLFQGREQDPDAPPVKAKRLKPPSTAPVEPSNGGWWTATKK